MQLNGAAGLDESSNCGTLKGYHGEHRPKALAPHSVCRREHEGLNDIIDDCHGYGSYHVVGGSLPSRSLNYYHIHCYISTGNIKERGHACMLTI